MPSMHDGAALWLGNEMQAISAITENADAGLENVYRDAVWRIARVASPELVLRFDPRLADLGCLDHLEEARFFASERILWVIQRKGILVATLRRSDDHFDAIFWKQPELIEIAACQPAWQLLPMWLQTPIWRRLLEIISGNVPVAHDRPEIRRLAERTFRARVDRALQQGNLSLLEELAKDCPCWQMSRDDLLQEEPCDLRRWHRLLRLPKDTDTWVSDFARALRHAAGLLDATSNPDE